MRSLGQALILMIVLSAIIEMWPVLVAVVVLVVASRLLLLWYEANEDRRAVEAARAARLIAHADREHAQVQQGDLDGIYGRYPVPEDFRGAGIWMADDRPIERI
ncbi:hypothetical protein [Mycolicibacterium celeriflavum]|uniref:Uncharacterized protein n=1 Tax=Mycolicibacterium celeriflavum TaxID=1249101 RepID=A0A1X0BM63_MYCCF|nr:hypothetical protein [Mycolicibacterium celeriflavum]MCV7240438.1 hypothetical protein [Mycolicibacterium celeriflavum]ORA43411.1 hypothetical protein BST21_21885 [Mycolicibacterium celeriflavum]BBY43579.1 hypothetical protein MCEL_18740 [Mycolicibacterium celeriflavum]